MRDGQSHHGGTSKMIAGKTSLPSLRQINVLGPEAGSIPRECVDFLIIIDVWTYVNFLPPPPLLFRSFGLKESQSLSTKSTNIRIFFATMLQKSRKTGKA